MNEVLDISQGIFPFLIIFYSIILYEVAHGYAAYIQGDSTALRAGRLTLNPIPHIDMIGSVIVPLVAFFTSGTFFGWAKPVPYNQYVITTRFGRALVASAGVLTNLFLALCAGIAFKILMGNGMLTESLGKAVFTVLAVNVSLAFFNLIPVPPFDGMSILEAVFPRLAITSRKFYTPVYMITAILIASVLYSALIPHVFSVIEAILL